MSYAIKVRFRDQKRWDFLSPHGTSRLRIHAAQFASAERAQALVDENKDDNPEWEWKVVLFQTGRVVSAKGGSDGKTA